jgi:putative membrane protein
MSDIKKLSALSRLPVILIFFAATGCNRKPSSATATGTAENPPVRADTTGGDSARARRAADTTGTGISTSGSWSEANIVALLDEANMSDSAAGAFALTKATKPEVKAFARLMMSEHHALRAQGQELARRLKLTPETPPNDPVRTAALSEMGALQTASKMSGFDQTYIQQEIVAHRVVLDLAGKLQQATRIPELKKLIVGATPVIQKHLSRAEAIQKRLGSP